MPRWAPREERDQQLPSVRERRYLGALLEGKPNKDAAAVAGYADPSVVPQKLRRNKALREYFNQMLEKAGIGDDVLFRKLAEGLDAERKELTKDGAVVEMGPDHQNRVKYLDMALKVRDSYPNPKLDVDAQVGVTILMRSEQSLAPDIFGGVEMIEGEFTVEETDEA